MCRLWQLSCRKTDDSVRKLVLITSVIHTLKRPHTSQRKYSAQWQFTTLNPTHPWIRSLGHGETRKPRNGCGFFSSCASRSDHCSGWVAARQSPLWLQGPGADDVRTEFRSGTATAINYSRNGMCLQTSLKCEIGQALQFLWQSPSERSGSLQKRSVRSVMRWVSAVGDTFLLGCETPEGCLWPLSQVNVGTDRGFASQRNS